MALISGDEPTVLVADDSADIRELAALQLRLAGYRVLEARDGCEAVELARRARPDLILMDMNMPGVDGAEATRVLRQVKELCRVVIVAFSAFSSGDQRGRALAAGCDAYVNKTKDITRLPAVVRRFLPAA